MKNKSSFDSHQIHQNINFICVDGVILPHELSLSHGVQTVSSAYRIHQTYTMRTSIFYFLLTHLNGRQTVEFDHNLYLGAKQWHDAEDFDS